MSDVQKINTDVIGIEDACEYLKLARSTVYRLTRKGIIPITESVNLSDSERKCLKNGFEKESEARITPQDTKT